MQKLIALFMLTVLLAGGALSALPAPVSAQVPPPVVRPVTVTPWVGANTPWVFYNGDWFLNGILYYFFGPKNGWAPYYAYPRSYIVRPTYWYKPHWHKWYKAHPVYWENFHRLYPHWREHHVGHVYGEDFYNRHHPGQGGGWQHGWHGQP
jgi:hypothetical protein